jgi:hypothetical protein
MRTALLLLVAAGGCTRDKSLGLEAETETGCAAPLWYPDDDGDGWGLADGGVEACAAPTGHVAYPGDCDDADAAISPDAEETCNGYDDDCDDRADDADPMAYGSRAWFWDEDGDGYGRDDYTAFACVAPDGFAANSGDCEDEDEEIHPNAIEACDDGVDADCDGEDPHC